MTDFYHQSEALIEARMQIAVHKTEIAELRNDIAELKNAFKTQSALLQQVATTLSEARGGWRTMMILGGASATFGGFLTWAVEFLAKKAH